MDRFWWLPWNIEEDGLEEEGKADPLVVLVVPELEVWLNDHLILIVNAFGFTNNYKPKAPTFPIWMK